MKSRQELTYELIESLRRLSKVKWFLGSPKLTLEEFMVLDLIHESELCSMKDITTTFSMPPSTATGLVDRLVERKYVTRSKSKDDRRRILIKMTTRGKKVHAAFKSDALIQLEESLKHLSNNEIASLLGLINKLITGLHES